MGRVKSIINPIKLLQRLDTRFTTNIREVIPVVGDILVFDFNPSRVYLCCTIPDPVVGAPQIVLMNEKSQRFRYVPSPNLVGELTIETHPSLVQSRVLVNNTFAGGLVIGVEIVFKG